MDTFLQTANLFSVLGATPIRGRVFTAQEDVPNGPRVAVIGHGLWQRRYAGDPSMVGTQHPDQRGDGAPGAHRAWIPSSR